MFVEERYRPGKAKDAKGVRVRVTVTCGTLARSAAPKGESVGRLASLLLFRNFRAMSRRALVSLSLLLALIVSAAILGFCFGSKPLDKADKKLTLFLENATNEKRAALSLVCAETWVRTCLSKPSRSTKLFQKACSSSVSSHGIHPVEETEILAILRCFGFIDCMCIF